MTTVATDGIAISADGKTSAGGGAVSFASKKLHRLPDGSIVGQAGTCTACALAVEELADSIAEDRCPKRMGGDYTLLRLHEDGKATIYWGELVGVDIPTPAAIGSGGDYAQGALAAGASAAEAVRIAAKYDNSSGGRVRTLLPGKAGR